MKQLLKTAFCLTALSVSFCASAEIQLESPKGESIVPLLSGNQKKLKEFASPEERKAAIEADSKEKKIYFGKKALWRQQIPVVFSWKCTAGEKEPFRFSVFRRRILTETVWGDPASWHSRRCGQGQQFRGRHPDQQYAHGPAYSVSCSGLRRLFADHSVCPLIMVCAC